MKSRLKDPDLARLFENTFPSTLDTTVRYFDANVNYAFIITGDIKYVSECRLWAVALPY
jgi:meiotically up-regulated gene 157 (Mug157) protein